MGTDGHPSGSLIVGRRRHDEGVGRLLASFEAIPRGEPARLAKKTSNLFRPRTSSSSPGLDTTGLTRVVSVDPDARTADVQGMCTYEDLVDATLPYGLMPYVVPQLKTITLGGAVTGLGIESSSFRLGLPHESVLEMDVLTGTGEIVTARPDGTEREQALHRGFPNSYGSLGYAVRLRIALEPVSRYVELRHVRFDTLAALTDGLARISESGSHDDEEVDFLDGVVFTADESYLTLGRWTDEPGPVSDYSGVRDKQAVYYRSIRHGGPAGSVVRDRLTIRDYLWRWDTDWFWCSRAFGVQNPRIRRLWPQQLLRSSAYWKIIGLDHRYDLGDRIGALKGEGPRERVVQDVEVTIDRTAEFLEWFLREVPIEPLWVCPLRLRERTPAPTLGDGPGSDRPWPLYPLAPDTTYVNIGFWSSAPIEPGMAEGAWNRRIEEEVSRLGGHKSLYSEVFYSREEFDQLYGGEHAARLKNQFDPQGRFSTLYDKAVGAR
ncbi:FAD-binding oxidoreductase [Dietzia psychralcaliphila]|uniref:Delta(24)-sterol reductase n=1 Tax=Dietzia psychralcaliphila TaxID=139021 RepID=A0AAD0JW08_9ACTN|nr:FAD-binding oxidoreductase [Dietzia psychralcaliphila]AWH96756.1 FAD-linked oxidase [Dietzia psychralcaliphila]PTM89397.1 FAD/FMN-containing dehydrogenase [Dietzia psychralcaliphila]